VAFRKKLYRRIEELQADGEVQLVLGGDVAQQPDAGHIDGRAGRHECGRGSWVNHGGRCHHFLGRRGAHDAGTWQVASRDRGSISPHRAAFDVVVTAAIFEDLIKHARWSEVVKWSAEPALYTKFHFGKYRGQRYGAIAASDPD
jgi:hypothetical protein